MKALTAILPILLAARAFAGDVATGDATADGSQVHRYLIERTFPAGGLDGLDAATKARVTGTRRKP